VVVEGRSAGTVMVQVENGRKLKASLNGKNAHCAGDMEVIAVLTVAVRVSLIKASY
jgi:hypothetical protein